MSMPLKIASVALMNVVGIYKDIDTAEILCMTSMIMISLQNTYGIQVEGVDKRHQIKYKMVFISYVSPVKI